MIAVADVEAELDKLNTVKRSVTQNIVVLVASLVIFAGTGLFSRTWTSVALLVVVLLIHECGHYLGMKYFGYRDLQIFFIPFFGAAASGKETTVSGERRAVVALLGPAPGILLGAVCGLLYLKLKWPILVQYGLLSVYINAFNLLPIYPLDGGRFLEAILFSRHPALELAFKILAVLALAALAWMFSSVVLGILAVLTLMMTRESHLQGKMAGRLRDYFEGRPAPAVDRIPPDCLEAMLPHLSVGLSPLNLKAKTLAFRADAVWQRFCQKAVHVRTIMALLATYVAIGMVGTVAFPGLLSANRTAHEKAILVQLPDGKGGTGLALISRTVD
jgi:Zn-dependent protease